jgi:hypothetical protein
MDPPAGMAAADPELRFSRDPDSDTLAGVASSIYSADDPLALRPPVGESAAERAARLQAEAHARRVSDEIDAQIKREKKDRKKAGRELKVGVQCACAMAC